MDQPTRGGTTGRFDTLSTRCPKVTDTFRPPTASYTLCIGSHWHTNPARGSKQPPSDTRGLTARLDPDLLGDRVVPVLSRRADRNSRKVNECPRST
jgi:hypothetical protein